MPQPTGSDSHIDVPLTGISVAYAQEQTRFIASRVFPVVPVDKPSNKYYIFDKNAWLTDDAQRRAPATESAGSGYTLSTTSYNCDVWAIHKDVDDQTLANSDTPLRPMENASRFVTTKMLLRQEVQWVADNFKTTVWGTDKVGATDFTRWNDYGSSDPITDIEAGKEEILSTTGFMPNKLILGYQVFRQLKHHPDVVDRMKYTSSSTITEAMLAAMFGVDEVLVASAIKATNNEGGTAATAFTHGKNALLCYAAPAPGLEVPSAGYTFSWTGVSQGLGTAIGIDRFYLPHLRSTRVEGQIAFDNKIVGTDLGYFFSTAVA